MKKLLISLVLILALMLSMGTCAFADDVATDTDIIPNDGIEYNILTGVTVNNNNGTIGYNNGTIETNSELGTVVFNHPQGIITTNNGTVNNNYFGTISTNNNIVEANNGIIEYNLGTVEDNLFGVVTNNYGKVTYEEYPNITPMVINNYGDVEGNTTASTGEIIYNFGGTYSDVIVGFNYYAVTSNFSVTELKPLLTASGNVPLTYTSVNNNPNLNGGDYTAKLLADSPSAPVLFYILQGAELAVEIPDNYTLKINGETATADNSGKATVKNVDKNIHLEFTPVPKPVSSVPNTADNSNMPLWGALFISFAALAMLTRKKKA